jgi:foldase protein PrsA
MTKVSAAVGAAVLALALLATGCGSVRPTAVTVNGERISQESVDDELRQIRDNEDYRQAVNIAEVEGTGRDGTFNAEFAAQVVTLRIYYKLVEQELDERGIEITAEELRAARDELELQVSQDPQTGQPDAARGKKILAAFSPSYQRVLVRRQAELARLQKSLAEGDVTEEKLQAYYDEHPAEFVEVCVRHVLLDTKEAADGVASELRGGADFATVAKAQSKDPSAQENGGDLQCAPSSSYVDEFAEVARTQPVGAVGDPVQTNFGFHVLVVYERTEQSFDDARDQIERQLQASSGDRLNEWLAEALSDAKIDVDERFGRFDRTPEADQIPRVVPPQARTTTTTLTTPSG